MEITPALGAATMLQTRVGQSMALVQNQLAPPERAGVLLQTGSQSITTAVLTGMKEVQQQSLEKLNAICGFLETQVEIEREKERRLREQSRELEKERLGVDAGENIPEPEITPPTGENKLKSFFGGLDLADVLTLGLATSLAAAGGAKAFAKKLGPKLIKGGIYAAIASAVAKPFVDFITGPGALDLELEQTEKDKMSDALIGAIGLGTIAGPMGVIVGAIGGYTKDSVIEAYKFVAGKIDASQIKDPEKVFGETALAAGAAGVSMNAAITLDHCELGTTVGPGYGVVQHCSGVVTLRHCTIASDAGALSNGNMTIEHCTFTGANNYASTIAAGLAPTITVRGSHAAAANAGNHTETVVAAIS